MSNRRGVRLALIGTISLGALVPIACSSSSSDDSAANKDGGGGGSDATFNTDGSQTDSGNPGNDASTDSGPDGATIHTVTNAAYGLFTCTVSGAALKCWGENAYGQLGRGTHGNGANPDPEPVTGLASPETFDLGFHHACAVSSAGVSCWGLSASGQTGHNPEIDLDAGGPDADASATTCSGVGCDSLPTPVSGLTGVIELSLADFSSCALVADGTVSCWGGNNFGIVGTADAGETCMGAPCSSSPRAIPMLTNVVEIAAGGDSACARKNDGTVWCWGSNSYGTLGADTSDGGPDASGWDTVAHPVPVQVEGLSGVTSLAAGIYHACVIGAGGAVSCWGYNQFNQLGHDSINDTRCQGNSPCRTSPTPVAGLTNIVELALGYDHSCALKNDGTVWCWGNDTSGQLGLAGDGGSIAPLQVTGLTGIEHIFSGDSHTCAVKGATVSCWGLNNVGQLGNGDAGITSATPVPVLGL